MEKHKKVTQKQCVKNIRTHVVKEFELSDRSNSDNHKEDN